MKTGGFTILQITDTQDDHYPTGDMCHLIRLAVRQTSPDFIIFTGDLVEDIRPGKCGIDGKDLREGVCVYGIFGRRYDETLAHVRTAAAAVFSIPEGAGIPFAFSPGNNDHACGVTSAEWLDICGAYDHCLVKDESGDPDGRIDFRLEILSHDGAEPVFNIWVMDAGEKAVTAEQIDWYERECAALKAGKGGAVTPSVVFEHIPVADIGSLFERCRLWDRGAIITRHGAYRLKNTTQGHAGHVYLPGKSSVQFSSWVRQGDVTAAFFGHEHTDGYSGNRDGIELVLTYGSQFEKRGPWGVRVITLNEHAPADVQSVLYRYEGSVRTGGAVLVETEKKTENGVKSQAF